MAEKIIAEATREQLEFMLHDIASNAETSRHLLLECMQQLSGDTQQEVSNLLSAAICLIERTGWCADAAGIKIGGSFTIRGGAENWMMPPAYHNAVKAVEVTHD